GGARLKINPVTLPLAASYPGLKKFIQDEEIAAAAQELANARAVQPTDPLRAAAAEARLKAIHAVIEADRVKYHLQKGDAAALAKAAAKAQAFQQLCQARHQLDQAERQLASAQAKKDAASVNKAEQMLVAAKKQLAAAEARNAKPTEQYTPLTPTYQPISTGRRTALANWLASTENPLTARVAVNHMWMRHFGEPLVKSVFDFGLNGKAPTQPELLDWLAIEFMESKWSMKHLHKLIVTSRTYQSRSSMAVDNPNLSKDADNRWLWRFNSRRLEAEVIRDAMLFAAGDLNTKLGGKEIEPAEEKKSKRRSLYFTCHPEANGSLKLLEFFDAPDPCDCYRRAESQVPQQALALTNSEFALERSRSLATRWLADAKGEDTATMITKAFEEVLTRRPTKEESVACMDFLKAQASLVAKTGSSQGEAQRRAWESFARVLFSHHEFATLR
ncbi:MAG: DUF1553 domain-containing protein, partial [Planctomycetes bacterium]|nr:DUF1553 domain-containing protein [Planctomycetota bacterium]